MHTNSITILINGEQKQVPPEQSVSDLLLWLNVASDRVAVEMNKNLVRKRDWTESFVENGCQIEIVEFVGGG